MIRDKSVMEIQEKKFKEQGFIVNEVIREREGFAGLVSKGKDDFMNAAL